MAIPIGTNSFRPVSDYRVVKATIEQPAMPMQNLEALARFFTGARAFFTLDMLRGYRQISLSLEAQPLSTMVTPGGLYISRHVLQDVLNATASFQEVTRDGVKRAN